jgi:ubiquinone/menaquinone biosynthesis C-methylase UbiE
MHGHRAPETTGAVIHWAARYDLVVWLLTLGRERAFREKIVRLASLESGESVLDVGCGTGTLAIAAKRVVGATGTVHGVDASPEMIARARKKATGKGIEVVFERAIAEELSFPNGQFDAVLTSMTLHHLPRDARQRCLREIRRVLKSGGRLLAVDFGGAAREKRSLISHFHRHMRFDVLEVVPMLSEVGMKNVESGDVGFLDLRFVRATAP